jgi:KRAB domain-containing zinc finger protein
MEHSNGFSPEWTFNISFEKNSLPQVVHLCGRSPQSYFLHVQMATHSNETPYICDICGKGFKRRDRLREHTRIHTRDKSYICTTCGKTFHDRSTSLPQVVHLCGRSPVCVFL